VMPAIEPGLRRHARHPPSLLPLAVGRRHRLVATAPCRCTRVASTSRACPRARARAGHGSCKRAPQHACAVALKARPGLGPLFRAYAVLAVLTAVHRTAAPP
jgi:hypothetical protein